MKIKTSTKEKGTDFERARIEEGIHLAELKEIKEISEGTYGQRVAFIYNIIDKNAELALVCYLPEAATSENRFGQTIMAHGVKIDDKEIDTDSIVGTKVNAWVEDFEYEVEENGNKVKKKASSISKVKPINEKI